jgi:hypothetical protein
MYILFPNLPFNPYIYIMSLSKRISKIFSKKRVEYRKGYIHFGRGKYPKLTDNPYKEGSKKYEKWNLGFLHAIDDLVKIEKRKK